MKIYHKQGGHFYSDIYGLDSKQRSNETVTQTCFYFILFVCVQCLWRPEENSRCAGAWVWKFLAARCECWKLNLDPPQEQQMLSPAAL